MSVFFRRRGEAAQRVNYVNFIQSTGTQYIDTEFKPSGNALRVVMKFRYTAAHSGLSLFGNHNAAPYSVTPYGAKPQFYVGTSSSGINCGPQTSQGTDYILDVTANNGTITAIWNGVEYTATYSGSLYTDLSIFLFGSNNNGKLTEADSGYRLEYFQIYDNSEIVRDLWPCYDPDGVACLYDEVEKKYYYNAGSGVFRTDQSPATTIAVTITGAGDVYYCYATINGTNQYSAGTHEVSAGDTITFCVYGSGNRPGTVTIDGTEVLNVTAGSEQTYDWTVPNGISTVEIAMSTLATKPATGRITVTTA